MNTDDILEKPEIPTEEKLRERAKRLRSPDVIASILGQSFVLAGGAMREGEPRDFDIFGAEFPIDLSDAERKCREDLRFVVLARTDNAITAYFQGQTVQFCKYHKPTPMALVWSFDFTHIQAGVVFDRAGNIQNAVYSEYFNDVEQWNFTPEYNGSEYPLSSLARLVKFHKRGDFSAAVEEDTYVTGQVLKIMCDIIKRGFRDDDDFSDQCTSISGALAFVNADELFALLQKSGRNPHEVSEPTNPF